MCSPLWYRFWLFPYGANKCNLSNKRIVHNPNPQSADGLKAGHGVGENFERTGLHVRGDMGTITPNSILHKAALQRGELFGATTL